jgi:hypothetical protein
MGNTVKTNTEFIPVGNMTNKFEISDTRHMFIPQVISFGRNLHVTILCTKIRDLLKRS